MLPKDNNVIHETSEESKSAKSLSDKSSKPIVYSDGSQEQAKIGNVKKAISDVGEVTEESSSSDDNKL